MSGISSLNKRIKLLRRKVKLWFLIDGLSRLVIYLLPYLIFTFWIDYLIRDLPVIPRLCFLAGAIIIFFLTFFKKVIFPLIRLNKIPDDSLIFLIEKEFPVLDERLINLWQLLPMLSQEKHLNPPRVIISELKKEVVPVSQSCDFSKIFSLHISRKILFTALMLVFFSILALDKYPVELNTWSKRLWGSAVKWPKRTTLSVKVIPDYIIGRGQNLSVIAWADKGPRLDAIYIRTDLSRLETDWQRMILTEKIDPETKKRSREFRCDFIKVQSSLRFMIRGGDDRTEWLGIKVLNSPALEKITVHYDYPGYTGLPGKTEIGGNIKAPRGTKATVNGFSNIKLQDAYWILDSFQQPLTIETETIITESEAGSLIIGNLVVEKDIKYSIHISGTNGLKNVEPIEYYIKSIPDNHPVIKVLEPDNEIEYVTPEATLPLKALITDDYGISDAQIRLLVNNQEGMPVLPERDNRKELWISPLFISPLLKTNIELTHDLDLTPLNLKEGASVILNFIATDNCAIPSPQTTTSPDYSLIIIGKSQMEKRIEENLIRLKDDIKKTLQIQESAMQSVEIPVAISNQRRVTQNLSNVSPALSKLINDINNNKLFSKDISDKLDAVNKTINEIHANKSPQATQLLEKISPAKQRENENKAARDTASAKQQEIMDDLSGVLNSLEEWEDYQDVVNSTRELLAEAQKISEKMKKLDNNSSASDSNPTELEKDRIANQAKNLQKEAENLEKKMARVSDKLKPTHPYYSEKLKQGMEKLKQDSLNENIYSLLSSLSSSLMGQAIKTSENVQNTLSSLIDFLEDRVNPEELKQKLADLKKMLEKVNGLKNEEQEIYDETLKTLDPSGEISALSQQLDSLLLDQKALGEVTGQAMKQEDTEKLADAMKKLAEAQKELREQADDLENRLQKADSKLPQSDSKVQQASQGIKEAADKMAEAAKNMQESSEQGKPSASGGSEQPTPPQQQQSPQSKESNAKIAQNQKDALQNLRQARESLKQFLNRQLAEEEKRKLERLARRQKELEEETLKSSRENKESQESLQNAARKMAQAQDNLSKSQPNDAQQDEQEALDELERLYEFLARQKDDLDQKQKEKTIEELHAMLTKILNSQININNRTAEVLSAESEIKNRENVILLEKLSAEQSELSGECNEVKTKLDEEKSIVFSWTLNSISDDMQLSSRLLAGIGEDSPSGDQGAVTNRDPTYIREVQTDIVRKLKELIEALRNEKNRRKPLQTDEEGDKNKLLPLLSELKMLKTMQDNLLSRTGAIRDELINIKPDDKESALVHQMILQRLTAEQGHLAEMTKDLIKKVEQLQQKQHP
jgi:hypothetical protein